MTIQQAPGDENRATSQSPAVALRSKGEPPDGRRDHRSTPPMLVGLAGYPTLAYPVEVVRHLARLVALAGAAVGTEQGPFATSDRDQEAAMYRRESLTVSVVDAAQLLGISRALAYELVARGELPSLRLGRRVVVPRRALEALVEEATLGKGPHDKETDSRRERASLRVASAPARGRMPVTDER